MLQTVNEFDANKAKQLVNNIETSPIFLKKLLETLDQIEERAQRGYTNFKVLTNQFSTEFNSVLNKNLLDRGFETELQFNEIEVTW